MTDLNTFGGAIIAGIIIGSIILLIGLILLIWFVVTLCDIKNHLKSIDLKITKTNQNLCDIKLYNYQMSGGKVSDSNNTASGNENSEDNSTQQS